MDRHILVAARALPSAKRGRRDNDALVPCSTHAREASSSRAAPSGLQEASGPRSHRQKFCTRVARRWLERFPIEDADAFVERIPYKETRSYVKKVLKNYTIYKTLNGSASDA